MDYLTKYKTPLKNIDDSTLLDMAKLPINSPEIIYEINFELASRKLEGVDDVFDGLISRYEYLIKRQAKLQVNLIHLTSEGVEPVEAMSFDELVQAANSANYIKVVKQIEFYLLTHEQKIIRDVFLSRSNPKRYEFMDWCKEIVDAFSGVNFPALTHESELIEFLNWEVNEYGKLPDENMSHSAVINAIDNGRYIRVTSELFRALLSKEKRYEFLKYFRQFENFNKSDFIKVSDKLLEELRGVSFVENSHEEFLVKTLGEKVNQIKRSDPNGMNSFLLSAVHQPTYKTVENWSDAAKLVRNAKVPVDTKDLQLRLKDFKNWADISPLRMLGYGVGLTSGLSSVHREEFLLDFCNFAVLPSGLPEDYARAWGEPGSKIRVFRTLKHLDFLIRTNKKRNDKTHDFAIAAWEHDWNFLRKSFWNIASSSEWVSLL